MPAAAVSDARPRRRRLAAAARRASILDAAIPLFASGGYEQTRMSDLAAYVGVTEPVIFQNFGTKAELFAAALEHASRQAADYLLEGAAERRDVLDWLARLLAPAHLDHLHTAPMFGVLFADAHRLQFVPEVSAALHRGMAQVADALASILDRGQTESSIRPDVPPLTLAWLVVSLIQARQFRHTFTPRPSTPLELDLLQRTLDTFRPQSRIYPGSVPRIYHITTAAAWNQARGAGSYTDSTRGLTLAQVGFIHCSHANQVPQVAEAYYRGVPDLVLLVIDTQRLGAELRDEDLDQSGQSFPHIYGPLNLDAVVEVVPVESVDQIRAALQSNP
jgi:uncharacterized protein (DUF952 family)/AcrR family transcriptional regulator